MRSGRLALLLTVGVIGLAGCGGDDGEGETTTTTATPTAATTSKTSTSPTSSSSTSPSDGSTEPPKEAQVNTKAGAEAFAKWYYSSIGDALVSGDSATVKEYAEPSCKVCAAFVQRIDENDAAGRHADKNPYTPTGAKGQKDGKHYNVRFQVSEAQYVYKAPSSAPTTMGKTSETKYEIVSTIHHEGTDWTVDQMVMIR